MEKYYLISGKALANIQFRSNNQWYDANQKFENIKISERDLLKYRRFMQIDSQSEIIEQEEVAPVEKKPTKATPKTQPKVESLIA